MELSGKSRKAKMKWEKKGLIYGPDGRSSWARHSALQPTPLLRADQGHIRIFVGMRDDEGVGRIGFVDVASDNPAQVLRVSQAPVLDIGVDLRAVDLGARSTDAADD